MVSRRNQKGFSMVELLVVILILLVLTTMAVLTLATSRKYSADDQARKIIDVFDEARQKALNQRTTFRVEINRTKNRITLINENTVGNAADDVVLKSLPLSSNVVIGAKPNNVPTAPTSTSPVPVPSYSTSNYPLSSGDQKITLRFRRNGQVVDAGTDNVGTGSLVAGATIYVTSTKPTIAEPDVIRAVMVKGTTGDTLFYKCQFNNQGKCVNWSK